MNKAYKVQLYPNLKQQKQIDQSINCSRFMYNQMLAERVHTYLKLKNDKEKLYSYKFKTEKEYKKEFLFLTEASSRALQQSRINLDTAFKNYFRKCREGKCTKLKPEKLNKLNKKKFKTEIARFIAYHPDYPQFKVKKISKGSYREPQVLNQIKIEDNKIQLLKLGQVRFRYGSKEIKGKIKSVTVEKSKSNKYYASVLCETELIKKERKSNSILGLDLGLKTFCVTSDGNFYNGIKDSLYKIENKIKFFQKKFARQEKESKRREKTRIRIAKLYEFKTNKQNYFFWHLANKLCSENQTIVIENLNVKGMVQNRKLSHSIYYSGWGKFVTMLKQKSIDYDTGIVEVGTFFPSSKLCSVCGNIKVDLNLSDRVYECECGNKIDRDLNASLNLRNTVEFTEREHRENVRPVGLDFNFAGSFSEVLTQNIEGNTFL